MKSLMLAAAASLLLFSASVPSFAVDNSISSLCDGAPEHATYARPGGYCDHVASNQSLNPSRSGLVCEAWETLVHHECVCAI